MYISYKLKIKIDNNFYVTPPQLSLTKGIDNYFIVIYSTFAI